MVKSTTHNSIFVGSSPTKPILTSLAELVDASDLKSVSF